MSKLNFSKLKINKLSPSLPNFQSGKMPDRLKGFLHKLTQLSKFLRNSKIQTRLMISFLALSIIPLLITGIVSYQRSSQAMNSKITTYSSELMNEVGNNIEAQIDKYISATNEIMLDRTLQDNIMKLDKLDDLEKFEAINAAQDVIDARFVFLKGVRSLGIVTNDKTKLIAGESNILTDEVLDGLKKELDKTEDKQVWVHRKLSNMDSIIFFKEVRALSSNQVLGQILLCVKQESISSIYKELKIGDGSHIYIVNSQGTIISSKKLEEIGTAAKEAPILQKLEGKKGTFGVGDSLASYKKMENTNWTIVGLIPYNFIYSESKQIRSTIIVIILFSVLLSLLLSFIISRSISVPLLNLVTYMKKARDGDLTIDIKDKNTDEIADVTNNFHDMLFNIKGLISKVHNSAQKVLNNADIIASAADQSYSISEQMAATILQIAQGASSQAADISDGVSNMGNLSNDINDVGTHMDTVTKVVRSTKSMSNDMQSAVRLLNDKALQTNQASEKIVNDIFSLNDYMKEIKGIVKMIVAIAEQTNLLSLNAAIEAARAGDAGKGFAVVAEEVRKLADQSKDATITINNIINKIQSKTEQTVNEANNASTIIKQQMEAVHEADNAFKTIFGGMDDISTRMEEMSHSISKILTSKNKTMEIMENISAVSEEAAATAQEVSASTHEQINRASELSASAKDLNEMADELDKAISTFKFE